jgi:hypothetical protein
MALMVAVGNMVTVGNGRGVSITVVDVGVSEESVRVISGVEDGLGAGAVNTGWGIWDGGRDVGGSGMGAQAVNITVNKKNHKT